MMISKFFSVSKQQGVFIAIKKSLVYLYARFSANLRTKIAIPNSQKYWEYRMKYDWNLLGGGQQTMFFAAGAMANLDLSKLREIESVIDYGCGTGDSAIILRIFFQNANIYLYDISKTGVQKGLNNYSRFFPVYRHEKNKFYDFVYCSNVIEHVNDPLSLVNDLISISKNYILIQCPWKEIHSNGDKISPENPTDEHIWTIDEEFYEQIIKNNKVKWTMSTSIVPMAWEGGIQAFFFGEKIDI